MTKHALSLTIVMILAAIPASAQTELGSSDIAGLRAARNQPMVVTGTVARKLRADSRAGVQSTTAQPVASARPAAGAAPGVPQRGQSAAAQPLGPQPPDLSETAIARIEQHVIRLPLMERIQFFRSGLIGRFQNGPLQYSSGRSNVAYSYFQQAGLKPDSQTRNISAGLKRPFRDHVGINCVGDRSDKCVRISVSVSGRDVLPYVIKPAGTDDPVLRTLSPSEGLRGGFVVTYAFESGRSGVEEVTKTFVDTWLLLNLRID